MQTGKLYIVPTPIGNLSDITMRAIDVLKSVALIGAEDTRKSALLLRHYNISTPTLSYHKFNEKSRLEKFINILNDGKDIAIISDAGTPGISDPAALIIREALRYDIIICPLPGASAFLPALVSSGFDCSSFLFCGFLPVKDNAKKRFLQEISQLAVTLVFYEAPHRLISFLQTLKEQLGNRRIVIYRELTKKFETSYRNDLDFFLKNPDTIKIKGEFTIVCEGATNMEGVTDFEIIENLKKYLKKGETKSFAVNMVSKDLNIPKNRVYTLAHHHKII